MRIIKEGKKRKLKRYYGKCPRCSCEFSESDMEISYDYSRYAEFEKYSHCPNDTCNNQNRIKMTSKRI
jgi:hypothetical protein